MTDKTVSAVTATARIPTSAIEERIVALEQIGLERRDSDQRALSLHSAEVERRLHDLNGSQKRQDERNRDFVSRELYDRESDRVKADIANLYKIAYIGFGIILALQFLIQYTGASK